MPKEQKEPCILALFLLFCICHLSPAEEVDSCPAECICTKIRSRSGQEDLLKVKCGGGLTKITSMEQLLALRLPENVVHLDISDNIFQYLPQEAFSSFPLLQKLNINKSQILAIDNEAFANLTNLKRLDLFGNRIKLITAEMFAGLSSLERLGLGQNSIVKLKEGIFNDLSLKQLDISGNPLLCDCELGWLLTWARNESVKLVSAPKCGAPPALHGQPLRKLRVETDFHCNWPSAPDTDNLLELKPSHSQVVFEGDSLRLRCRAPSVRAVAGEKSSAQVTWMWDGKDPVNTFKGVHVKDRYVDDSGLLESSLSIDHLLRYHSGEWNCQLVSEQGNQSQTINIIVISEDTKYCPQKVTSNNKGLYTWPKTVVGHTVELLCEGEQVSHTGQRSLPRARYTCTEQGTWVSLNTSDCPYVSETTKILEQFSQVNLSLAKSSVLESAKSLRNFTANTKDLRDKMDIVFISKTVENYLEFVVRERDLGSVLVDIVSIMLHLPKDLMTAAQLEDHACSRLVRAMEHVAQFTPSLQSHKSNLAVEEFRVKRESFPGLTCTWYSHAGKSPGRLFHCSTSNSTARLGTNVVEASIQIPASLFYQLEMQGIPTLPPQQLMVAMFENNRLFPRLVPDGRDITSCVIGTKLVGVEVQNLSDPVYVMLRAPLYHHLAGSPKPVWWDATLNNGTGGWSHVGCQLSHLLHGLLVFQCNRLGYFGLLQKDVFLYDHMGRVAGAKFRFSHPAIYIGSFVGVVALLITIVTYIICHASIQMSKKTKHSLINTWVAIALLCFMYSLGIHQTEDTKICQGVGLCLHYLTLSSLLWMAVSVSNMYKRLTKSDTLDASPEDELPPEQPVAHKPLLGLYLVGWGIALIVCGISGAVNMREYAGHTHCFLNPGPALSAVLVPASMLVLFLMVFLLLSHCAIRSSDVNGQLSEGTQATENVYLDLLDVNPSTVTVQEHTSLHSTPTASSDVEDPEHSPLSQLKAHVIVLLLYLMMWTSAAIATAKPLHVPHEEAAFSILYGLLSSALGSFVTFFYCVVRSDVRSQWHMVHCWCRRRSRTSRCCRTRSISDTNPAPLPPQAQQAAQGRPPASSSNSINSNIAAKSQNGSLVAKTAASELNGSAIVRSDEETKISNVNLVMLHRRQYRSHNSVTEAGSAASGAEMFYNPHQSTVARKFFRKQRRHMRHGNLGTRRRGDGGGGTSDGGCSNTQAESAVFLSSDMENTSGTPATSSVYRGNSEDGRIPPLERLVIGAEVGEVAAPPPAPPPPLTLDRGVNTVDDTSLTTDDSCCNARTQGSSTTSMDPGGEATCESATDDSKNRDDDCNKKETSAPPSAQERAHNVTDDDECHY